MPVNHTPLELLAKLSKMADFFEVLHVTTFKCARKTKAGHDQEVTVKIYDAGPDTEHGVPPPSFL